MSLRFTIKDAIGKAEKEGDSVIRFSGVSSEPVFKVSERETRRIGIDAKGEPKLVFTTGLEEDKVQFFKWYSEEDEKKEIIKQIKEYKPIIRDYFGGEDVIEPSNRFFWRENRDVFRFSINNETTDVFYDTKNPVHALLYLSIVAGAFIDTVAPTKDWAERTQVPYYLALETDDTSSAEENEDYTRSDAHALLSELRREESPDALFIIAWCVQYDTNAFGAYARSTSVKDLVNYHIKYIDGKLVTKQKKNTAKTFVDYVTKWKGQQTRPRLYAEAYLKAGEYFSFLQQREKKYTTDDGTILGGTITEAVDNLLKPRFSKDLDKLRTQVENKWKE